VASSCEHGNELLDSIKRGEFVDCVTISFSRMTLLHYKPSVYVAVVQENPDYEMFKWW
jgi:hypothetical protein